MKALSPRLEELRVELLTARTLKDIAFGMGLSEKVARLYTSKVYAGLDIKNGRTELMYREIERLRALKAPFDPREPKAAKSIP